MNHAGKTSSAASVAPSRLLSRYRRVLTTFGKYATSSLISTAISQAVLIGLYGFAGSSATLASVLALLAGAVPNFLINRRWTWGRKGRARFRTELLPYLTVIGLGALTVTMLSTFADYLLGGVVTDRFSRTVAFDLAFIGSYGIVALAKFAALDRLVFRGPAAGSGTSTFQNSSQRD